ncbi:ankyrin repeat protein, putative [Trichomonas vaginalis G3]|uniref:Ankyrin repeat protein, putative n=1 Tax=Trichomonas vaginalis (strain ATCC PRA-98 / G3) TaxID=412133 RepID=A2FQC8_TRIV3|nr:protein ubiquitination [Trichomonas vaginalis G3]EAX92875.1 ankyrin repeat protein, putative [Trichomonas vaginalis G3]KAI5494024.1 protein ubiquitination [Trichomonas vaginalis G3]|eukprot:XP_001305805.1 ankyrin repeat protein [Trichomonas vaginalis G3]
MYDEAMSFCKAYHDTFSALYKLDSFDETVIDKIFQDIKINLIETKVCTPSNILYIIPEIVRFRCQYFKSYWFLFKKVYDEYQPGKLIINSDPFQYLMFKEYGIPCNEEVIEECKDLTMDVYEKCTINRAIMENDLQTFIKFTELEDFDENQTLHSIFYPRSMTLLELCCYHGSVDCFKLLISKFGLDITENCFGLSFLSGKPDIVNECLKYTNLKDPFLNDDRIKYAMVSHNIDFVSFLMNECNIHTILINCTRYNNIQAFLMYLDQTKSINKCFVESPAFNLLPLCEYLLSKGADINAKNELGETCLFSAANYGNAELIEFLISHGADVNARNDNKCTPLFEAANKNNKEAIECLIAHGADVNAINSLGDNPLFYLLASHNKELALEIAEIFISNGIDFNKKNEKGMNAFHQAAYISNKNALELFILHGADFASKSSDGKTALHYAAVSNARESYEFLISHDIDVNAKDKDGNTAIHYITLENHRGFYPWETSPNIQKTFGYLVSHGADINAKNNKGKTALQMARDQKNTFMENILKSLGAE